MSLVGATPIALIMPCDANPYTTVWITPTITANSSALHVTAPASVSPYSTSRTPVSHVTLAPTSRHAAHTVPGHVTARTCLCHVTLADGRARTRLAGPYRTRVTSHTRVVTSRILIGHVTGASGHVTHLPRSLTYPPRSRLTC
eukprot:1541163-Rhodomonas_salina.1